MTLVHQEQSFRLDGHGARSHSDAANHSHTILLNLPQVLALKLQHPVQPLEVIGGRIVGLQSRLKNQVRAVGHEKRLAIFGEQTRPRARTDDANLDIAFVHVVGELVRRSFGFA